MASDADAEAGVGGTVASASGEPNVEAPQRDPQLDIFDKQLSSALEKHDFNAWTLLIATAERLNDVDRLRQTYDSFLAAFPLCYGYWQKYADVEARHGSPDRAQVIYERGVAAIPNSADLWIRYTQWKEGIATAPEAIRSLFERALAQLGSDYTAQALWERYIGYETTLCEYLRAAELYSRAAKEPLKNLDGLLTQLHEFVKDRTIADLAPEEAITALRPSVQALAETDAVAATHAASREAAAQLERIHESEAAAAQASEMHSSAVAASAAASLYSQGVAAAAQAAAAGAAHPGSPQDAVVAAQKAAEAAQSAAIEAAMMVGAEASARVAADTAMAVAAAARATASAGTLALMRGEALPADDVIKAQVVVTDGLLKSGWVTALEAAVNHSKAAVAVIKPFEDGIRRPYFHVKPLDSAQVLNWSRYLDHAEKSADRGAAVKLYERCLVACAGYPELWERYVRFLEGGGDGDAASSALQRSTQVHCKQRPEAHLFAAYFQEQQGDAAAARASLELVIDQLAEGDVKAIIQRANFERRQGDCQTALRLCKEACSSASATSIVHATRAAARLAQQWLNSGGEEEGRGLYSTALSRFPTDKALWDAAIAFEASCAGPERVQRVLDLYARAMGPPSQSAGKPGLSSEDTADNGVADAEPELTQVGAVSADGVAVVITTREAATGASPAVAAVAASAVAGLKESEREEMSAQSVEWADAEGDMAAVTAAAALRFQLFKLPLKITDGGRKRTASTAGATDASAAKRPTASSTAPPVLAPAPAAASAAYPAGYAYPAYGQPGYGAAYQYPQAAASYYAGGYAYPQQPQYPAGYTYPAAAYPPVSTAAYPTYPGY